jgi:hypothetical protein
MFENVTRLQEFEKVMNVPFAVIIASFIIIMITTNMTDNNGLSALLGGYIGLLIGMLFVMIINLVFTKTTYLDMFPIGMIVIIVGLLIFYLRKYFDRISKGEVSGYYSSFSLLSTIFLFTQVILILISMYGKTQEQTTKLFSDTTFSLLGLFSVINLLIVLTIGIILHFYSTQG